jgi:hypothetical protein
MLPPLRFDSIVINSGLVTDRAVVYLERACDPATDWAGTYSSSSGLAVRAWETSEAE